MKPWLPLLVLLLSGCADTSYPRSELQIDDADAWQALCKDGVRVRAATDEGICADHRGLAMWTNKPRAVRMAEEAAK
ncbi:hypothetical protein [Aeromonas rivipollensis]|uniref:hypothetical protein n=1 Tax=Aeromonas rivipollensis TaxID=948519 RepID=UPI0030CB5636